VTVDLWDNTIRRLQLERRPDCPTCVGGHYPHLAAQMGSVAAVLCGRDAVQLRFRHTQSVDLEEMARRLASLGQVECNEYLLRFRAEGRELVLFDDGRAVVKGVADPNDARRYYSKYIGL